MKLMPLKNKIVVEVPEPKAVTSGGIHIPGRYVEKDFKGVVTAVGKMDPDDMPIKVGDLVLFEKYATQEWIDDDTKLVYGVIKREHLVAILER